MRMDDNTATVILVALIGFPSALRAFAKVVEAAGKPKTAKPIVSLDKTPDES